MPSLKQLVRAGDQRLRHGKECGLSKAIVLLLGVVCLAAMPLLAVARPAQPALTIYLRRGAFDPVRALPAVAPALQARADAALQLVQFEHLPTSVDRQALAAAGYRVLAYIPENTLLVARARGATALDAVAGVRWHGPLELADKLAPGLEVPALAPTGALDLRVLLAADADMAAFEQALVALGGSLGAQAPGVNGVSVRVHAPAGALLPLLRRDDVLWIERALVARVANDRARMILGVTAAQQQLGWLDGAGQIAAVTDTGLDVQAQVLANTNADFAAGRIAAAFTPAQMNPACAAVAGTNTWSDRNGHGTHVSGSVLGAGVRAPGGPSFAGVAPAAQLVVQSVSIGGADLSCLADDATFLEKAYAAGARVQNASWGAPTGGTWQTPQYGGYDDFARSVDEFVWAHPEHLLVTVAGNWGADVNPSNGVVDGDSIISPGTAKNVLTVGASENNRPPTGGCAGTPPQNLCWSQFAFAAEPLVNDWISDDPGGMAAWSSRGPADDGRIKPEIVAPGTNIVSAASHDPTALYPYGMYSSDYAYDSGTSMAAPLVSGMAVLVRQWLAHERGLAGPSAALIKALLLNGAANLEPGQYGDGATREIPLAWPNNVEGWGRADLSGTLAPGAGQSIWFDDARAGLSASGTHASYTLIVAAGQPLRLTLAWSDYPAVALAGKALVNDLDLELIDPQGNPWRGNHDAQLSPACRDQSTRADRCNNLESIEIAAPLPGAYSVTVKAAGLAQPGQPFALAARASYVSDRLAAPELAPIGQSGPVLALGWSAVAPGASYTLEMSTDSSFAVIANRLTTSATSAAIVADVGTRWYRVRACLGATCSAPSNLRSASVTQAPWKYWMQLISNGART